MEGQHKSRAGHGEVLQALNRRPLLRSAPGALQSWHALGVGANAPKQGRQEKLAVHVGRAAE